MCLNSSNLRPSIFLFTATCALVISTVVVGQAPVSKSGPDPKSASPPPPSPPWSWSAQVLDKPAPKCFKILFISPICAKSHNHMYSVIADALGKRCHDVTMLISYPTKVDSDKVTQLTSPTYQKLSEEAFMYKQSTIPPFSVLSIATQAWHKMNDAASVCERFIADPLTKKMLDIKQAEKYDYILFSPHLLEECALAIVHFHRKHFNTPWGLIFSSTAFPWADEAAGNPSLTSTYPVQLLDFSDRMTFWQRFVNFAFTKYFLWARLYWSYPRVEAVLRREYDPEIGSLAALERTTSMFMQNIDERVFFYPHVKTPQTILVGALHCRDPKPLPKELNDWVEASGEHGIVLFSLGSFMKGSDMGEDDRNKFAKAFGQLKQRVLWRWDGQPFSGLPPNVKLMQWIPQQDVLGHPKCRAFVTHGGMLGMQEASYHGVPMVGFPMGADQHLNLVKSVNDGVAIKLDWYNYTAESLAKAINRVIEEPSFKRNIMKRKELLQDQPEPPLARAVWWIEYMARHLGADHLRVASRDLEWYQVYLLDVWAFVLLCLFLVLSTFVFTCRLFCGKKARVNGTHLKRKKAEAKSGEQKKQVQQNKPKPIPADNGKATDNGVGKKKRFNKQD